MNKVATIDFTQILCPGNTEQKTKKVSKKARSTKPIVHQVFADIAVLLKDPFWKKKFTQASFGKFPAKFNFTNGALSYTKGTKSKVLYVPNNNIFEAATLCCKFFREVGGIYSPSDNIEVSMIEEDEAPLTWTTAGKKSGEILLSYFYQELEERMSLAKEEVSQLKNLVRLAILNKYLGQHNIHIENRRIVGISGLHWNSATRRFYLDPNLKPVESRSARKKEGVNHDVDKDSMPRFTFLYQKRLEHLRRKTAKLNNSHDENEQFQPSKAIIDTSTDTDIFSQTTDITE